MRPNPEGWEPADRQRLIEWWLANYPGPGGTVTYWYALEDPWTQALSALKLTEPNASVALGGDLAADLMASWRRPERALLYADSSLGLQTRGFVTVADPDGASLILRVPEDPSVFPATPEYRSLHGERVAIADRLQVLWDLFQEAGPDDMEGIEQVLRAILSEPSEEP
ncbi:MAG: hypothetical protein ACRDXD_14080 [Acidimicrobiia bacterium]